jgi:plasmid segregation protein ParM
MTDRTLPQFLDQPQATVIGLDIGYGWTKATDGERAVHFPSLAGNAEEVGFHSDLAADGANRAVSVGGRTYFIGDWALLQSRFRFGSELYRERLEGDTFFVLYLAALSNYLDRAGKLAVVTGLPVRWFDDRDALVERLSGQHRVAVGRLRKRVEIEQVVVVPQPFGALCTAILGDDGRVVDADLAGGRVGVIDVGTYTTDYIVTDKMHYVKTRSSSITAGLAAAYDAVAGEIERHYGLELSLPQVDEAVRDGHVKVEGRRQDIARLTESPLGDLAGQIVAGVRKQWGNARDVEAILLTGGGAVVLQERLSAHWPQARPASPTAAWDNARGFWRYGRRPATWGRVAG